MKYSVGYFNFISCFVFVLDVSFVTRVLLSSVYRSRLIRICVNRFLSVIFVDRSVIKLGV